MWKTSEPCGLPSLKLSLSEFLFLYQKHHPYPLEQPPPGYPRRNIGQLVYDFQNGFRMARLSKDR